MNMRTTLMAAALAGICTLAAAQAVPPSPFRMNGPARLSSDALAAVLGQLSARQAASSLPSERSLRVAHEHPGPDGAQVVRLDQLYNGVRIFGAETVVVADHQGTILSESSTERQPAAHKAALALAAPGFNVQPALSAGDAIDAVLKTVSPGVIHVVAPRAELIVYPIVGTRRAVAAMAKLEQDLNAVDLDDVVERWELAWLVRTRLRLGQQPVYHDSVVSAASGKIIDQWSMLQTAAGSGKSQYNGTVPLSTTQDGERFTMRDPLRGSGGVHGAMAITNANHGTEPGELYVHSSNEWGDGKQFAGGSTLDANGQTAAVNAMWGMMNSYDMWKNVLNWHAMDGQNTATLIATHVNTAYDNAYYSDTCKCMFIGDGSYFNNLASVDVVAHEMGHGLTAATSNLVYFGESGGLNESSSDIAGEVVEAYARAAGTSGASLPPEGNDWVLGKEISKNATPLRWMYRPSKDGSSPDAWSATIRRLDVHYSSGPNNRMFYFLAQGSKADPQGDYHSKYLVRQPLAMRGIGIDKAYRIWFKAATTKFTSSTNYKDARAKMLLAAAELYGAGSAEAIAVQRAYAAINVGEDIDEAFTFAGRPAARTAQAGRAPAGGMAPR